MKASSAAQLVELVERRVARGELAPGQPLPSVRRLAVETGLSPATVASAIAQLRRRGVVLSEPRRGTRIGPGAPVGSARAALPVPEGAHELSLGNPDPELLPDLTAALRARRGPARPYGSPRALPALLAGARERLRRDAIPAEHVCVLSGTMDAIERVVQAHLRPGDRVAVESPGYAALFDLLRAHGLALEPVAVDDRGMRPAALRAALARGAHAAFVTPRGQNPFGAAIDARRARELSAVLDEFPHTLLVEDDHFAEVAGTPLHTLVRTGEATRARWATTRSVAKALGPDLRVAVLAGDAVTVARVEGRQRCGPGWVSHILQELVLALWSDPAAQALVARASAVYARRRERLLACLEHEGVRAHGASGLNVWIPVAEEAAAVAALLARGWVLAPGSPYRLPGAAPGVRVTAAALDEQDAPRLARDIADVLAPSPLTRSG
jgi:DNA-binding transcriptional MocR family regulator